MMASVEEIKLHLIQAAKMLFEAGVMQHSGHGNMSVRVDTDRIVITTGGLIRNLTADDFAVVTLGGKVLEGRLDPVAAEIVDMHAGVYRTREAVGSVIRTHSPAVTSFAVANKPLPAGLDLSFSIRIAHTARQRGHTVVRQHVAIDRIQLGIVDVGLKHAFAQIVENDDARNSAQPAKCFLVQFGSYLRAWSKR